MANAGMNQTFGNHPSSLPAFPPQHPTLLPKLSDLGLPSSVPRKRALNACRNCRGRKARCDEAYPCSNCENSKIDCSYLLLPPSKPDRLDQLVRDVQALQYTVSAIASLLEARLPPVGTTVHQNAAIMEDANTASKNLDLPIFAVQKSTLQESDVKAIIHPTAARDLVGLPNIQGIFEGIDPNYIRNGENNHNLDLSTIVTAHSVDISSLSVDQETVRRLLGSYFENVHILLPFIDRRSLSSIVECFINQHSSNPSQTIQEDVRDSSNGAKKRKFSKPRVNHREPDVWRTVENALILLLLAIGEICDKGPLPVSEFTPRYQYSPSDSYVRPATPLPESLHRPVEDDNYARSVRENYNLPGAVYFSHATSILGELLGWNSLIHVQAHLLAGVYLSQLVRIYDCWKHIHAACVAWQMFFKTKGEKETLLSDEEIRTYWACLICESDILADLDVVKSGISKFEDRIPIMISNHDDASTAFQAQISIQKILNGAYAKLRNTNAEGGCSWAQLEKQLQTWYKNIPVQLSWNHDDPPADTVSNACLRLKYLEAQKILFRALNHDFSGMNAYEYIEICEKSTTAFKNVLGRKNRLIMPYMFHTAYAQFVTMLVLSAEYFSSTTVLRLSAPRLLELLDRTIKVLSGLAPLSPTIMTNVVILERIRTATLLTAPANPFNNIASA